MVAKSSCRLVMEGWGGRAAADESAYQLSNTYGGKYHKKTLCANIWSSIPFRIHWTLVLACTNGETRQSRSKKKTITSTTTAVVPLRTVSNDECKYRSNGAGWRWKQYVLFHVRVGFSHGNADSTKVGWCDWCKKNVSIQERVRRDQKLCKTCAFHKCKCCGQEVKVNLVTARRLQNSEEDVYGLYFCLYLLLLSVRPNSWHIDPDPGTHPASVCMYVSMYVLTFQCK